MAGKAPPAGDGNGAAAVHRPPTPKPAAAAPVAPDGDGMAKLKQTLAAAKAAQERYATFTQEQVRCKRCNDRATHPQSLWFRWLYVKLKVWPAGMPRRAVLASKGPAPSAAGAEKLGCPGPPDTDSPGAQVQPLTTLHMDVVCNSAILNPAASANCGHHVPYAFVLT